MKGTETNSENVCLDCGYHLPLASALEGDDLPEPGCFSICINCGGLAVFTETMALRKPTDAEIEEMPADVAAQIDRAQTVTRAMRRTFGKN